MSGVTDKLTIEEAERGAMVHEGTIIGDTYKQLADTMRENERLRLALKTIAEFPISAPHDQDAMNMGNIAYDALEHPNKDSHD